MMDQADLTRRLDALASRLDEVVGRLERIESSLHEERGLREQLRHEQDSRRALADQTSWLIEVLGDARKEARWLKQERDRLTGDTRA